MPTAQAVDQVLFIVGKVVGFDMTTDRSSDQHSTSLGLQEQIDEVCDRFKDDWTAWREAGGTEDRRPRLEAYLGDWDEPRRSTLFLKLLDLKLELRASSGEQPDYDEYASRFPEYTPKILERFETTDESIRSTTVQPADAANEESKADATPPIIKRADVGDAPQPERIGRYEVRHLLGSGQFGTVYLAYDGELNREVAVKVQRRYDFSSVEVELFRKESEIVAQLDHPHIVPVYDAGQLEGGKRYVVSKRIDGENLQDVLARGRPSSDETAAMLAMLAEALQHAHGKKLVHRDIKPANILIDATGKPYVADFGLALTEADFGDKSLPQGGTLAYMSPEQARKEGHRIDGRSDIFSLGVVMYEMLTGERPFTGTRSQVVDRIKTLEARPPRQLNDNIPKELERICLKALAKRATERYTTALDMADDLRHLMEAQQPRQVAGPLPATDVAEPAEQVLFAKIVPKGLRAFDENDADFFLQLLPGPRDRDGLPESIRFWKTRIDQTDADKTFAVGLIYGPSGCGKSSLVKAGLLPRLADHIVSVYVEAMASETETRLLKGLRKCCPTLPDAIGIADAMAALRRGSDLPAGRKILIVLDQFEQWLHAKQGEDHTELVQALRHCDGSNVQCVVMVRDDFWLAVSRFMQEMEIPVVETHNSRLVDLFDPRHARVVLTKFGQAFGALPEQLSQLSTDQQAFLEGAVSSLCQGGKVVCVRLALFAEMMKGKTWTIATLKEVGGTEGVGSTFLEETFSAAGAPPEHRLHQKAARGVLKDLLPESGTNIKGHMRSYDELMEASGYAGRRPDFAALIRILDNELRLVTPTDPEAQLSEDEEAAPAGPGQKYYQLTHDYLVPSLRIWLTRKQKETRRGRAELRLSERAAAWNAKPENRHLPAWSEFLNIRFLTRQKTWTEPQQQLMRAAQGFYLRRLVIVVALAAMLGWLGYEINGHIRAAGNLDSLKTAKPDEVLNVIQRLRWYHRWAKTELTELAESSPRTPTEQFQQLHAQLALVTEDKRWLSELVEALQDADPRYVKCIRDAVAPFCSQTNDDLWQRFRDPFASSQARFNAALVLASHDTSSKQWTDADSTFLVQQLVSANPIHQPQLWELLGPVKDRLLDDLERVFGNEDLPDSQLLAAANALTSFAKDDMVRVAKLLCRATPGQFDILWRLVAGAEHPEVKEVLSQLINQQPTNDLTPLDRVTLGQRSASAAVARLRLGARQEIFPIFQISDDPEAMTQFIHRCRSRGVTAAELLECLRQQTERAGTSVGTPNTLRDYTHFALARVGFCRM